MISPTFDTFLSGIGSISRGLYVVRFALFAEKYRVGVPVGFPNDRRLGAIKK